MVQIRGRSNLGAFPLQGGPKDSITTNFLQILTDNFENRLIFDEVKEYKNGAIFGAIRYILPFSHEIAYSLQFEEG